MSSRAIRKLRAQEEHAMLSRSDEEEESDGEEEDGTEEPAQLKFNPFELIHDQEDDVDSGSSSPKESPTPADGSLTASVVSRGDAQSAKPPKQAANARQPGAASKHPPAASRRAKRKGPKGKAELVSEEADIDQLLKDLDMSVPQAAPAAAANAPSATDSAGAALLSVNTKRLKAEDEMQRIFGASVLAEEARSRGGQPGRRGHNRGVPLRKGMLVTPKPHWPPLSGGLSMEVVGTTEDGSQLFGYVHSSTYAVAQTVFEDCQAGHDPNAIMELLHQTPYHTDSLLTMNELYRSMGEHASAEDMLQRCLYTYEMAWHHSFSPASANCRLDFDHEPNKGFFLALFRHIQGLSRRGLHRTALEIGKLLLALDPRDPMGMLFYLDFLALCANDAPFLQRLAHEWQGDGSLALLPNFAFSLALALFDSSRQPSASGDNGAGPSDSVPASDAFAADAELSKAVAVYPLVVRRLMAKFNEQGVGRGLEWQAILGERMFAEADDSGSRTLSHCVDIFVERHHLLWKSQEVQDWLRGVCKEVDASGKAAGVAVGDWAAVRSDVFPPSDANRCRHLRVADFSDSAAVALPAEELQAIQQQAAVPAAGAAAGEQQQQRANLQEMGTLEALMRSLLPSFNAGNGPPPEEDQQDADRGLGG